MYRFRVWTAVLLALAALSLQAQDKGALRPAVLTEEGLYEATITPNSARFEGHLSAGFLLRAQAGSRFWVTAQSEDLDPYLVVEGPDGLSLSDDDSGPDLSSQLEVTIPPGGPELRLFVRGLSPEDTGLVTLLIERQYEPEDLVLGQPNLVTITEDDSPYADSHYREFGFLAEPGFLYEIRAESAEADTYLVVTTELNERMFNDDWDGSTDSFIEWAPEATQRAFVKVMPLYFGGDVDLILTVTARRRGKN